MKLKPLFYNERHNVLEEQSVMPKATLRLKNSESFGKRIARLRQTAGYSQRELATDIGISQRMIAYYESKSQHPPTHILPIIAKALGVTADQLLGMEIEKKNASVRDNRLWRRFAQVEKLPPDRRRPVVQFLDAFLKSQKIGNG